jgi:hypothetical protein
MNKVKKNNCKLAEFKTRDKGTHAETLLSVVTELLYTEQR